MNADTVSALVNLVAELASKACDAYVQMRDVAQQAGVSQADLAAADARFQQIPVDPLAHTSTVGDPPPPVYTGFADYDKILAAMPPDSALKPGDQVFSNGTQFYVEPHGLGSEVPAGYVLHHAV